MLFVTRIRQLRGMPVMRGSADQLALRLRKWRFMTKATVVANYAAAALLEGAGVLLTRLLSDQAALWLLLGLMLAACRVAFWLQRIDMSL